MGVTTQVSPYIKNFNEKVVSQVYSYRLFNALDYASKRLRCNLMMWHLFFVKRSRCAK